MPEVEEYLNELNFILFQNHYFGFLESSFEYVDNLVDYIEHNLSIFPHKDTPENISSLGSKYIFYKINHQTTWYIFFENEENRYIVTYITNNHTEFAQFLGENNS